MLNYSRGEHKKKYARDFPSSTAHLAVFFSFRKHSPLQSFKLRRRRLLRRRFEVLKCQIEFTRADDTILVSNKRRSAAQPTKETSEMGGTNTSHYEALWLSCALSLWVFPFMAEPMLAVRGASQPANGGLLPSDPAPRLSSSSRLLHTRPRTAGPIRDDRFELFGGGSASEEVAPASAWTQQQRDRNKKEKCFPNATGGVVQHNRLGTSGRALACACVPYPSSHQRYTRLRQHYFLNRAHELENGWLMSKKFLAKPLRIE